MANNDNGGELFGALVFMMLVVMAAVAAVMALMSIGAVYGAGTALLNYGRALRDSIQPEKAAV